MVCPFLLLHSIPLSGCLTVFYPFPHWRTIRLFLLIAITNRTVCRCRGFCISLGDIPKSGMAGSYDGYTFNLWGTAQLFSGIIPVPCCLPRINLWEFQLLTILSPDVPIFYRVKWYLYMVLICVSLVTDDAHLVTLSDRYLCVLFGEVYAKVLCPPFHWVFAFILLSFENSL